jgi:FMN reductase
VPIAGSGGRFPVSASAVFGAFRALSPLEYAVTSILVLSGSPSATSRTALLAGHIVDQLGPGGFDARHLAVRDLPAEDLIGARADSPAISTAVDAVAVADGVVIATPVYKAAYSGALKTFLDLLPQSALAGKTVLPLVTGGTPAHALVVDYALRPVLAALDARHVVSGLFLLDRTLDRDENGQLVFLGDAAERLSEAVDSFIEALPARTAAAAGRGF